MPEATGTALKQTLGIKDPSETSGCVKQQSFGLIQEPHLWQLEVYLLELLVSKFGMSDQNNVLCMLAVIL